MDEPRRVASRVADRINGERLVLLGWPCAILMQVAHPLVAAGVAGHSTFRDSPLAPIRRLRHTVQAMLGLTFGDDRTYGAVIGGIREIHRRVHGVLIEQVGRFPAGTCYSAEDPALLLWVHATLIRTTVLAYETLVAPLAADDRDEYCAAGVPVAVALGADAGAVPRTWPALCRYVDDVAGAGDLAVGRDARALAQTLLHGPVVVATGPVAWAERQLTALWLPPAVRDLYGIRWSDRDERRCRRVIATLKGARRVLPDAAMRWPAARARAVSSVP